MHLYFTRFLIDNFEQTLNENICLRLQQHTETFLIYFNYQIIIKRKNHIQLTSNVFYFNQFVTRNLKKQPLI